jgi:metal-dependent hydrolase (beta-lactamase superfamily II)
VYVRSHLSLVLQITNDRLAADHGVVAKLVFNNFEIADMDLWRGEAYTAFFNHLDHQGGFYYEVRPSLTIYPPPPKAEK